jgi:hypothetical protein
MQLAHLPRDGKLVMGGQPTGSGTVYKVCWMSLIVGLNINCFNSDTSPLEIKYITFSTKQKSSPKVSTMATKKIITVFGATGAQGGSVVKSILGDAKMRENWIVRGVTRDTTKASAKALEALGAETVAVRSSLFPSNPLLPIR